MCWFAASRTHTEPGGKQFEIGWEKSIMQKSSYKNTICCSIMLQLQRLVLDLLLIKSGLCRPLGPLCIFLFNFYSWKQISSPEGTLFAVNYKLLWYVSTCSRRRSNVFLNEQQVKLVTPSYAKILAFHTICLETLQSDMVCAPPETQWLSCRWLKRHWT